MKIEIPKFKEFPDSNIAVGIIVNPFWLEHLLNLFFQGYIGSVWEEIIDTETKFCSEIENIGYGLILMNVTEEIKQNVEELKHE